jgi:hypothetical protein
MHTKAISSIFSKISIHHKHQNTQITRNWQGIFGAAIKFSLALGFHEFLTFSDLIKIFISIMIVEMHRVLRYKHCKGYVVFL